MNAVQCRRHIQTLREYRKGWLDILNKDNPDSLDAAQHVVSINAQIGLLNSMRYAEGDFSVIKD